MVQEPDDEEGYRNLLFAACDYGHERIRKIGANQLAGLCFSLTDGLQKHFYTNVGEATRLQEL